MVSPMIPTHQVAEYRINLNKGTFTLLKANYIPRSQWPDMTLSKFIQTNWICQYGMIGGSSMPSAQRLAPIDEGQIDSAMSQGCLIARLVDIWLGTWDQPILSQGEDRCPKVWMLRGLTSWRKAEETMSRRNNQIEIGRRDTFLPSWTHRENNCSNGLRMHHNEEWWLHSH